MIIKWERLNKTVGDLRNNTKQKKKNTKTNLKTSVGTDRNYLQSKWKK